MTRSAIVPFWELRIKTQEYETTQKYPYSQSRFFIWHRGTRHHGYVASWSVPLLEHASASTITYFYTRVRETMLSFLGITDV